MPPWMALPAAACAGCEEDLRVVGEASGGLSPKTPVDTESDRAMAGSDAPGHTKATSDGSSSAASWLGDRSRSPPPVPKEEFAVPAVPPRRQGNKRMLGGSW